ncbi:MAG: hypothetical protein B6I20_04220 [Bacteroidetes bacterium 4572_117]|nr:MAG: hypothetical protein B6I20_04220 [Bacteroidetes bacterium 4572_117]
MLKSKFYLISFVFSYICIAERGLPAKALYRCSSSVGGILPPTFFVAHVTMQKKELLLYISG